MGCELQIQLLINNGQNFNLGCCEEGEASGLPLFAVAISVEELKQWLNT